jgi:SAM-dependent methyltransferase
MIMDAKSWQLGSPGTAIYRLYDSLRQRVNYRLAQYLLKEGVSSEQCIVVEAGSGPAFASSMLGRDSRVALAVAMDIDLEALREARRRDPLLALVVGDLHDLPFRTESLDLIWNSSTLEHLDDPLAGLREMVRSTRQEGRIFVGLPYLRGPIGFQRWIPRTTVGVWLGTVFDLDAVNGLISSAGARPKDHFLYFFRFFLGALAEK